MASAAPSSQNDRQRAARLSLLLGLAVALVFGRTLANGFINFDDPVYVTENPHVLRGLTWDGLQWAFAHADHANWHPVTWLSHMLDVTLFGTVAAGHHATSVLVHSLNTGLLLWLFYRMTGRLALSFLAACLFGIHPLRVESVAWVAERKDLLCGLFSLIALAAYARYTAQSTFQRYAVIVGAYALALMAKPMAVTLPAVMWLLDGWPLNRQSVPIRWRVMEKLPLLAMAAGVSAITYLAQDAAGAVGDTGMLPWSARVGNAVVAYVRYMGKTAWPSNLGVFYPHPGHWPVGGVLVAAVVLVGISALAWRWRRDHGYLLTGWCWYLGMLAPVIGIIQVGRQSMADRYTYLPGIGLGLMAIWGIAALWRRYHPWLGPVAVRIAYAVPAVVLIGYAGGAWRQTGVWADATRLFTHTIAVAGPSAEAHFALGSARLSAGDPVGAEHHYRQSLVGDAHRLDTWRNLAEALHQQNKTEDAIAMLNGLIPKSDDAVAVRIQLGTVLASVGRLPEAVAHYRSVLDRAPGHAMALDNLGLALVTQGYLTEAIAAFGQAAAQPDAPPSATRNLARTHLLRDRIDAAIGDLNAAVSGVALTQAAVANARLVQERLAAVMADYRRAVSGQPGFRQAHWRSDRYLPVKQAQLRFQQWAASSSADAVAAPSGVLSQ